MKAWPNSVFHAVAVLVLATSAVPAKAQLFFSDEGGRAVEFSAPDIAKLDLSSQGRSPGDIATLFRKACLDSKLNAAAIDSAVSAQPWMMVRRDTKIPFTGPAFDTPVPRWLGGGFSLIATAVTIGITKGSGFRIAGPQCTLASGEASFSRQDLEAALTEAIGSGPMNAEEALKKGKPNKNYSPRWQWTGATGQPQDIGVTMMKSYDQSPGRVQISLIPPKLSKTK